MKTASVRFGMGLVLALLLCIPAWANPIGRVTALQGQAVASAPGASERALAPGEPVFLNDTLSTGPGAKMLLLLLDESTLAMGERSILVLDEYTYAPRNKKENRSALSLLAGTLKIISGEITKLNPDRFRVQTPLATVGIRGCHLGFSATDNQVDVYVISLRTNESIFVQAIEDPSGNSADPSASELAVSTPLRKITISRGGGLEERPLSMPEIMDFIESVSPSASAASTPAATSSPPASPPQVASAFTDEEQADWPSTVVQQSGDGSQGSLTPGMLAEPLPTPEPEADPPAPRPDPPDPTPVPPAPDPDRFVLRSSGTDWQWGIWENAAGSPLRTEFKGTMMDQSDWSATLADPTSYALSGMGEAAALVRHGDRTRLLEGTCHVTFNWGGMTPGTPANFYGSITLNNAAGDYLAMGLLESVDSSAVFTTVPINYYLSVDGESFSAFTQGSASGYLVGHSPIDTPTGIVGEFAIEHGSDASVWGGFGSDLAP